jgi:hypothetical protein
LGWLQRRRGNYRVDELICIAKSDEQSPPAPQAVVPMMNLGGFFEAFNISVAHSFFPQRDVLQKQRQKFPFSLKRAGK